MLWKQMCPGLLLVHRSTAILVLSLPSAVVVPMTRPVVVVVPTTRPVVVVVVPTTRPVVVTTTRLHSLLIFRRHLLVVAPLLMRHSPLTLGRLLRTRRVNRARFP